MVKKALIIL